MSVAPFRRLGVAAALVLLPSAAFAHPGHLDAAGLAHGFAHPVTGLDHVLAMVMVGVLAWQIGGRALFVLPATFLAAMALGGALGVADVSVPIAEPGIAVSVIVLGAAVALGARPLAVTMAVAGLFAIFHGHAHGVEMPAGAGGFSYGLGFLLGTALLHAAGIAAGFLIGRTADRNGAAVTRAAGALVGVAGVGILAGFV